MLRAFIFDLDGTLIDTEILWVEAVQQCMAGHGYDVPYEDALKTVYGISWQAIYEDLRKRYPEITMAVEDMAAALQPHFIALRDSRDVRIRGSVELLKRLSKDYPVAIVSGAYSEDIRAGIKLMNIEPYLSFYLGDEHVSKGKPHPACYLLAAEKFNLLPEQCLVFEDSASGIDAAKDAGMHCVALARDGRPAQDTSRADLVLADLAKFSVKEYEGKVEAG